MRRSARDKTGWILNFYDINNNNRNMLLPRSTVTGSAQIPVLSSFHFTHFSLFNICIESCSRNPGFILHIYEPVAFTLRGRRSSHGTYPRSLSEHIFIKVCEEHLIGKKGQASFMKVSTISKLLCDLLISMSQCKLQICFLRHLQPNLYLS